MKKPQHSVLLTITCVFTAFILGFLLGRNYNHTDIQVSNITAIAIQETEAVWTVPPTTAVTEPDQSTTAVPTEPAVTTEPTVPATTAPAETQTSGLININTATLSELITLPGIGEVIGQRIIDYRQTNGPFTNIAQITNVSGIGTKRFEAIADLITVE